MDYELEGTPVVHAVAMASDLWKVFRSERIASIDLDTGPGVPTSANWLYAVEGRLPHTWGIDGKGESIALQLVEKPTDADYSTKVNIQATANPNGATSTKASWTMGFIRSRPGVIPGLPDADQGVAPSPGAYNYMANMDGYQGQYPVEVWAYNQGARAIVYAMGSSYADQGTATNHDKFVDYFAKTYRILVVASAGNRDVASGACNQTATHVQNKFLNGLIVGGVNDRGTRSRLDDTLYECSSYSNPTLPWWPTEVPHVVAPAKAASQGLDAGGYRYEGTSASAAIVGGIVSLVHDKAPAGRDTLRTRPEPVRAIIMATAWRNVHGGRLNLNDEGVGAGDDRDGVGEVSAARAVQLADHTNKKDGGNPASTKGFDFGDMSFPGSFPNGWYNEVYNISLPPYSRVQAVLAWSATSTCSDYRPPGDCGTTTPDNNLDLYLFEGTKEVAYSVSAFNAYEYVYYSNPTGATKNLTLRIRWMGSQVSDNAKFGIAWDTWQPATCQTNELCGPSVNYSENEVFRVSNDKKGIVQVTTVRLGTGEWVVVWATTDGCDDETSDARILYQLLDFDGEKTVLSTPGVVAGCRPLPVSYVSLDIAPLEDDRFVVVWDVNAHVAHREVEGRVYLGDGTWSNVTEISPANGNQFQPGVTAKGNEFWVVWRNHDPNLAVKQIVGRRCTAINPDADISCGSVTALSSEDIGTVSDRDLTRADTLSDGRFVVVWGKRPVGTQTQLKGRVFSWSGTPSTSEFEVSPLYTVGSGNPMVFPDVSALGTLFVVSWRRDGIKARVFSASGSPICTVANAHDGSPGTIGGTNFHPKVTGSADGMNFRVAWIVDVASQNYRPFWRKYLSSNCSSQGQPTQVNQGPFAAQLLDLGSSDCCETTGMVVWSTDCAQPTYQTCLSARVMAW